jgi:hypothetical protein
MLKNNAAVFILSHGRPSKVITYSTLRKSGYTGKIFIIIDDKDKKKDEYIKKFGDEVIIFSKDDYKGKFDIMDNLDNDKVIVYARNASYDIARNIGLNYFFEYEDDYTSILYRYVDGEALRGQKILSLDKVFDVMIDCLNKTGSYTIAFCQGGDYIGGVKSLKNNTFKRKAMNTFVFKVNKDSCDDLPFLGRMNDDVNTYLTFGKVGKLFFQITNIGMVQVQTQKSKGGNTEIYKQFGTYSKSFYSVMIEPSCCKISAIGTSARRIHHSISWKNAVPKIIKEEIKKYGHAI